MTKKDYTHLTLVVDRSGSMGTIAQEASSGINALIQEQSEIPGEITVSLYEFDDTYHKVFGPIPASEAPEYTLVPRGLTALLDAVGKAIVETGEFLAGLQESNRPEKVLFAIVTDGGENASKEYDGGRIKQMVTKQESIYSWEFVYQGANVDAFAVAGGLGITTSANYMPTGPSVRASYAGLSAAVSSTRQYGETLDSNIPNLYDEDGNVIK